MPAQARFYVDIPFEQLDQVEQFLNSNNVRFCQIENMVHLPSENLLDSIFTGADAEDAIQKVNEHLQDQAMTERLPTEFHSLPPEARRDLLELITMRVCWQSNFSPTLLEIQMDALKVFLEKHQLNRVNFHDRNNS